MRLIIVEFDMSVVLPLNTIWDHPMFIMLNLGSISC
jgi:hypothetical protein